MSVETGSYLAERIDWTKPSIIENVAVHGVIYASPAEGGRIENCYLEGGLLESRRRWIPAFIHRRLVRLVTQQVPLLTFPWEEQAS